MLTVEQLALAADMELLLAQRWHKHLVYAMQEFGISSNLSVASFLAQIGHESAGFTKLEESFNYTPQALRSIFGRYISAEDSLILGRTAEHPADQKSIACRVYARRNGNVHVDDGWKYRGRGLIQITFLENYENCGGALGLNLLDRPQTLLQDREAARSAAWYWDQNGCEEIAGDILRVTKKINGGTHGLADRTVRFEKAKGALCCDA